ncbi:MAG TPA: hypothetical protein VN699_04160, partial [Pirellulales bacterium]|nr:hypothetical protein [Pirellulales bacterium]
MATPIQKESTFLLSPPPRKAARASPDRPRLFIFSIWMKGGWGKAQRAPEETHSGASPSAQPQAPNQAQSASSCW